MRLVWHPDGGELTGAQQLGQRLRIATVGFYTIIWPTRHRGLRDHDAVDPEALQKTIDHEPAWAGFVADLQRSAVLADARQRLAQRLAVIGDGPKEPDFTISTVIGDGNRDRVPMNIKADEFCRNGHSLFLPLHISQCTTSRNPSAQGK